MKKTMLMASLVSTLLTCQAEAPKEKNETLKTEERMKSSLLEEVIKQFVESADQNDVKKLELLLHPNYQILWTDGKGGLTVVDRKTYLENIGNKTWGGDDRTFEIISTNKFIKTTAVVQVRVFGKTEFNSFYSFVYENEKWLLLTDLVCMK